MTAVQHANNSFGACTSGWSAWCYLYGLLHLSVSIGMDFQGILHCCNRTAVRNSSGSAIKHFRDVTMFRFTFFFFFLFVYDMQLNAAGLKPGSGYIFFFFYFFYCLLFDCRKIPRYLTGSKLLGLG